MPKHTGLLTQMPVSPTVESADARCWPRFVRSIREPKPASPKPHLLSSLMSLTQSLHSVRSQIPPYPLLPWPKPLLTTYLSRSRNNWNWLMPRHCGHRPPLSARDARRFPPGMTLSLGQKRRRNNCAGFRAQWPRWPCLGPAQTPTPVPLSRRRRQPRSHATKSHHSMLFRRNRGRPHSSDHRTQLVRGQCG